MRFPIFVFSRNNSNKSEKVVQRTKYYRLEAITTALLIIAGMRMRRGFSDERKSRSNEALNCMSPDCIPTDSTMHFYHLSNVNAL